MERLVQVGCLSLGAAIGANARFWLGLLIDRWTTRPFPWATFLINVSGSFAIGLLSVLLARWLPHPLLRLHLITGLIGGYTTYSTFAYESLALWENGAKGLALVYMTATLLAGFAAVFLGVALARVLADPGS